MMNYDGKKFRPVQNSENGETTQETIFYYQQKGNILTSEYAGGKIKKGHLIGLVDEQGNIDMRYHQVNTDGELMTGVCSSVPEMTKEGKVRLHENWQWTSGDRSKGTSILEEL
nr:n-acetylglutamate synthase [Zobellia alginiliquefaciens]